MKIELQKLSGEVETLMLDPQSTFGSLKRAVLDSQPELSEFKWSLAMGEQVQHHCSGRPLADCGIEDGATLVVIKTGHRRRVPVNPGQWRAPRARGDCLLFFGYNEMSLPGVLLQIGALLLLYSIFFPVNAWTGLCSVVAMLLGVRLVIPLHDHHGVAQYLLQLALIVAYLWGMLLSVPGAAEVMELDNPGSSRAWAAPTMFSVVTSLALSMKWLIITSRPFNDDTGLIGIPVLWGTAVCAGVGSLMACCVYYSVVR
eukprot:gb/GFBE01017340.1/.p1 GENE.gb/GFBE01017340.1/~~gb/GFBE01017340.1/.p1  ORF type:complete len:257 (+),score=47.37 gb/GFBE01017340.1/:1-771(+)